MKIQIGSDGGYTLIGNLFIDKYMPAANGEFVKVYLYLLRCGSAGRDVSVSSVADALEHTEKDVQRALVYWEKQGLLKTEYDVEGKLVSVFMLSAQAPANNMAASSVPAEDVSVSAPAAHTELGAGAAAGGAQATNGGVMEDGIPVPPKSSLSARHTEEREAQDAIKQLIFVGSQYKKGPLRANEIQNIIYFYDDLHFSSDLIEYLMEYCVSKGNPGPHYMEKVAQEWYRNGIKTVTQAKESSSLYNKDYYTIMKFMGISGRGITKAEAEFMDRWLNEYAFSMPIIEEACRRTVLSTGSGSFSYADSILKSWNEHNVHTMDDIKREDEEHAKRSAKSAAAKAASASSTQPAGGGQFSRFPQRDYNWNELEAQLLAAQTRKGE